MGERMDVDPESKSLNCSHFVKNHYICSPHSV